MKTLFTLSVGGAAVTLKKTPQKECYSEVLVKVVFPTLGFFTECTSSIFAKFGAVWATNNQLGA